MDFYFNLFAVMFELLFFYEAYYTHPKGEGGRRAIKRRYSSETAGPSRDTGQFVGEEECGGGGASRTMGSKEKRVTERYMTSLFSFFSLLSVP